MSRHTQWIPAKKTVGKTDGRTPRECRDWQNAANSVVTPAPKPPCRHPSKSSPCRHPRELLGGDPGRCQAPAYTMDSRQNDCGKDGWEETTGMSRLIECSDFRRHPYTQALCPHPCWSASVVIPASCWRGSRKMSGPGIHNGFPPK